MKTIVTVPQPVTKFPLLIFKNSCPQLETNRTMERFKKKTKWRLPIILVHVLLGGARNIRGFFFFLIRLWRRTEGDDYETRDGLAQGSITFKIEYNVK